MKRTQERWREAEEKRGWMTLFFRDSERQGILAEMKEKHGIDPCEVAAFSFLVAKRGIPLTEEQMHLWEKLAKRSSLQRKSINRYSAERRALKYLVKLRGTLGHGKR